MNNEATKRLWHFNAEDENGDTFYLGQETVFIGTNSEADREAKKRSDDWENATGGLIVRITCESQGKVK